MKSLWYNSIKLKEVIAMRVALPKADFSKALSLLSKAVEKKSRLSFQWVKLKAKFDQHLELQGTNGEVYLTLKAPYHTNPLNF